MSLLRWQVAFLLAAIGLTGCKPSNRKSNLNTQPSAISDERARQIVQELRARALKDRADSYLVQPQSSPLSKAPKSQSSPTQLNPQFYGLSSRQLYDQLTQMQTQAHWIDTSGRQEWYETSPESQEESRQVVGLVRSDMLHKTQTRSTSQYQLAAEPLRNLRIDYYGEPYPLCSTNPYLDQPMGAFCSGVLVGKRVVATAAHCVATDEKAKQTAFVFDFRMNDAKHPIVSFSEEQVYFGRRILHPNAGGSQDDWQLVELTKDVADPKRIATFRTAGVIDANEKVHSIGYPNGVPVKISTDGSLRDNSSLNTFLAGIDVYSGNSGGPVFDTKRTVEGILIEGDRDYLPVDKCMEINNCPSGSNCRGDKTIRSTHFSNFIPR